MEGVVKKIVIDSQTGKRKAFGFIKADDGTAEIFVHRTAVLNAEWEAVEEGDRVSFDVERGNDGKGPRAENVRII